MIVGNLGSFTEGLVEKIEGDSLVERISIALRQLNVLEDGEELFAYSEIKDWQRGGDESFYAAADVKVSRDDEVISRPFVSKAIISMCIDITIKNMVKRKDILEKAGVKVPHFYSVGNGCINQQYLPFTVYETIKEGRMTDGMLDQLIDIAAAVDKVGFLTMNYVSDLMTDMEDVYYVDFGSDLGEPGGYGYRRAFETLLRIAREHDSLYFKQRHIEKRYNELHPHVRMC